MPHHDPGADRVDGRLAAGIGETVRAPIVARHAAQLLRPERHEMSERRPPRLGIIKRFRLAAAARKGPRHKRRERPRDALPPAGLSHRQPQPYSCGRLNALPA